MRRLGHVESKYHDVVVGVFSFDGHHRCSSMSMSSYQRLQPINPFGFIMIFKW